MNINDLLGGPEVLMQTPPSSPPKWISDKNKKYKDIINKAYKDALYEFYKHAFKSQIVRNFLEEGTIPYQPDDPVQVELLHNAADAACTKSPYIFLTVNPRPEVSLEGFRKKIEKFVNRKCIDAYQYVYEVRKKEGEEYKGLHCHILLRYICKPYDFKRGAKNTFKTICDVNNPQILNFRYIDSNDLIQKINYMKGEKQDKKLPAVKLTQEYRKKFKLEDMYISKRPLESETPLLGCANSELSVD